VNSRSEGMEFEIIVNHYTEIYNSLNTNNTPENYVSFGASYGHVIWSLPWTCNLESSMDMSFGASRGHVISSLPWACNLEPPVDV